MHPNKILNCIEITFTPSAIYICRKVWRDAVLPHHIVSLCTGSSICTAIPLIYCKYFSSLKNRLFHSSERDICSGKLPNRTKSGYCTRVRLLKKEGMGMGSLTYLCNPRINGNKRGEKRPWNGCFDISGFRVSG